MSNVKAPKPERPPGSPLFFHATGRWAKKIRGRFVYFGRGSHEQALVEYERQKNDLLCGRVPSDEPEGLTVLSLCEKFLATKKHFRDNGELSPHTFSDYVQVCQFLLKAFGRQRPVSDLKPVDFENLRKRMAKRWGLVRVGNTINKVRIVFNYAFKNGLVDNPMIYGEGFRRPSKKVIRKHRREQGPKMFEAHELRAMIDKAKQPLKTMLFLAANGGLGNSDVGNLPLSALNLKTGWLDYPRPKTGIDRRIPLWPETIQAIQDWLVVRPEPVKEEHKGLLFITGAGDTWAKLTGGSPVSKVMIRLMRSLGLNGHRNFYSVRHGFQTVADESGDFIAVRKIMGHSSNDIADAYRERISDSRLSKVTEHVRAWLFAEPEGEGHEPAVLPMAKVV